MIDRITNEFPPEPPGGLDARFCEAMDAAPVMIWVSGEHKGCVWFNRPWLNFTGRSMAEEMGNGWAEGVHRNDFDGCLQIYASHFDARKEFRMQYRLRRCDGAYRWVDDTGIPRYARDGTFLGYIGSCIDIHAHRQTQAELHRRLLEIVHLNRQADAAAFAATIAHEINQPLAAILSNTEAAEMCLTTDPPGREEVRQILADIRRDDRRAAESIGQMQRLLGKNVCEPQETDVNEVVNAVHQILAPRATDMEIAFSIHRQPLAFPVLAEPIHIHQAVLNLAMNGMDATSNNMAGRRQMALQTAMTGGPAVEVSVLDSGHTIPANELQYVFEPVFRPTRRGNGVGLSIVRTIVESYGGRIWAENRIGGGTAFRFTLPLIEANP
ncbi:MAG TPA: PAS domain-containing sensor histidine kinase [Xanthobacteraceae bacterium]|jgi:PAS domain S-box-containing protein